MTIRALTVTRPKTPRANHERSRHQGPRKSEVRGDSQPGDVTVEAEPADYKTRGDDDR